MKGLDQNQVRCTVLGSAVGEHPTQGHAPNKQCDNVESWKARGCRPAPNALCFPFQVAVFLPHQLTCLSPSHIPSLYQPPASHICKWLDLSPGRNFVFSKVIFFLFLKFLLVYICVCVCVVCMCTVCVCVHMHTPMLTQAKVRDQHFVSSAVAFHLVFLARLLMN